LQATLEAINHFWKSLYLLKNIRENSLTVLGGEADEMDYLNMSSKPVFHEEYFGGSIRGVNPAVVGDAKNKSDSDIIVGDILIVCAQVKTCLNSSNIGRRSTF